MFLLFCLAGVFAAGLLIRREVLNVQFASVGADLPFTLESALHFRRVKMLYDRGQLPVLDEAIQYPEGIKIREIDSITSEPVQAFLAGLFPDSISFSARIRWIESGWFCLSIPLLMITMRVWTGSWMAGFISALLYAVSLASVLRSTGQEISRENFAIPWLVASYGSAAMYLCRPEMTRRTVWLFATGILMAISLIAWDMIQYVLGLITLSVMAHILFREKGFKKDVITLYVAIVVSIFLVAVFHPYYQFHGLAYSPLMVWMIGVLFAGIYRQRHRLDNCRSYDNGERKSFWKTRWTYPALIMLGPVLLVLAVGLTGAYGTSYAHFAELLAAKIKFLNVKPADPSLMTYYQRIMWVPSLHSATWGLTLWLFPCTLWLSGLVAIVAVVITLKRPDPLINHWILFFGVSVAAYVLFVRFHVFVALAVAVLIGWMYGRMKDVSILWRALVLIVIAFSIIIETRHTYEQRLAMGRPNVYYLELKELADWLREEVAPNPVLANMGVSAYIAAYGKCPIVIHPKFEDPSIRIRLQEYGELLFGSDEKSLRDWMDDHKVAYYVYSKGEFAKEKPEYQMRYFVDMMNPPESVPAKRFESDDPTLRYFTTVWGNRKYVVYKVISRQDEADAAALASRAMAALTSGELESAENLAIEAVKIDRMQKDALRVLRHVGSLREQGFEYQTREAAP
jgi:Q-cell neuroblast polarisation